MMIGPNRKHALGGDPVVHKRRYTEADDQRRFVAWLRDRPDWMVVRIENAERRGMGRAARDKALGLMAGAPDLVLLCRNKVIWWEMKSMTGRLSDAQKNVHHQLTLRGQTVIVAFGIEDAIRLAVEIEDES